MPSRKRYQQQEEPRPISYDTALPVHLPVAVYYRQSTLHQVGNISTEIQTVDMVEHMKRMGWAEENIILVDMDAGISGTTKIDERQGMSELFRLITTDSIGAVSCQDEDRLFRDVTQIQVNIFIEACKSHQVLVITPSMAYNFSHSQMGTFHARQFRFKSEMAAEYIETFVKGRLHRAIRRVASTGHWAGSQMPAGYMVDNRKFLPSGAANPDYHKFVILEPYAEVVREYWRLFLYYGGQIRSTLRHIHEYGPYYPDPATCPPPDGYKVVYRLGQYQGKWFPTTRTGLKQMFTNAMYAGHWMIKGRVAIWNNHPAIIAQDTFMRAFNYLSDTGLDGKPNPHYVPVVTHERPSKAEDRDEPWPLCAGLIFAKDGDHWVRVGVKWDKLPNAYAYECRSKIPDLPIWRKKAISVDSAIVRLMLEKMKATFDFDAWEKASAKLTARVEEENSLRRTQLKQLKTVMDNLVANLATLQHPQMIKAAEQQYANAERECERLQNEMAAQQAETVTVEQVRELRESCGEIIENWPDMPPDEQREVLHTFVHHIEATLFGRNGLNLRIFWKDGRESDLCIPDQSGPYMAWLEEETSRLIALFEAGADQLEIAKEFPARKWTALTLRYRLNVKSEDRITYTGKRSLKKTESYNEYLVRIKKQQEIQATSEPHPSGGRPKVPRPIRCCVW